MIGFPDWMFGALEYAVLVEIIYTVEMEMSQHTPTVVCKTVNFHGLIGVVPKLLSLISVNSLTNFL